jgi:predicted  nucleic acid-binding Zn-ribbon protein
MSAALMGAKAASVSEGTTRANPMRRVVTMLQDMTKKVKAEGERDEELFEKFMCYCKTGSSNLQASIDAAETKIPQVESSIKEAVALQTQLKADLVQHKQDRSDAKQAIAEATAIRTKEAKTYAKDSSDATTNIAAMGKAITALEKGATGFLQTSAANVLRRLTVEMDLSNTDRDVISAFLTQREGYAPQSGEITGILKQMKETMEGDLEDLTKVENEAKSNFEALVHAKEEEISSLTKAIEEKTVREGETAVQIVNMKEDLDDTSKALAEDKKFLADMATNCATKKDEYAVVVATRAEELTALSETIKLLNDDDALELFKKTLPSASLLQVTVGTKQVKALALTALHAGKTAKDPRLDLISLALRGKSANFDKVLGMIDDMVVLLGKEQGDDNEKKAYCEGAFDKTEDEAKGLAQNIKDLTKAIEDAEERIATLTDEIAALTKGVANLDGQVKDATEQRQEENAQYTENMANNNAAKELIGIAKNRMNKFYNPKMYKAPPKRELSEEDRIAVNMGGTAPPTPAPGGIAGTGVTGAALMQDAPPPPPEAVGAYKKKGEESTGVIAMMDMLIAEVDKEMQEFETDEKNAQEEYEGFMQDSADKRALDMASIADKSSAKADTEAELEHANGDKNSKTSDAMAKAEEIAALHQECDWLVENFEARKAARAGEIDSLKKAKAVLSGADFSLVQVSEHRVHSLDPEGVGVPEKTKGAACDECNSKSQWLKDCSCHATDVWGTFANDATKELTSASGYGSTTENTGAKRLPEGWHWHCRPVSATEGVWQQC